MSDADAVPDADDLDLDLEQLAELGLSRDDFQGLDEPEDVSAVLVLLSWLSAHDLDGLLRLIRKTGERVPRRGHAILSEAELTTLDLALNKLQKSLQTLGRIRRKPARGEDDIRQIEQWCRAGKSWKEIDTLLGLKPGGARMILYRHRRRKKT
jgi:hypothetical protein